MCQIIMIGKTEGPKSATTRGRESRSCEYAMGPVAQTPSGKARTWWFSRKGLRFCIPEGGDRWQVTDRGRGWTPLGENARTQPFYFTLLRFTLLYATPLHSTPFESTPLHSILIYSTPLHCIPLCSTPPFSTLCSTPLHSILLYSTLFCSYPLNIGLVLVIL